MKPYAFALVVARALGMLMLVCGVGLMLSSAPGFAVTCYAGAFISLIFAEDIARWSVSGVRERCGDCGRRIETMAAAACTQCGSPDSSSVRGEDRARAQS